MTGMVTQRVLEYCRPGKSKYGAIRPPLLWGGMLVLAGVAQLSWLPCLCGESQIKMAFAAWLDLAYILRGLLALWRRETGWAWLIHGAILISSAFWIEPLLNSQTLQYLYGLVGIHPYSYYM